MAANASYKNGSRCTAQSFAATKTGFKNLEKCAPQLKQRIKGRAVLEFKKSHRRFLILPMPTDEAFVVG